MSADVFDSRSCTLGEGPLWHPLRKQLFWFDILGKKLLSQQDGRPLEWRFRDHVSAAGWIREDELLLASETGLSRFNLNSGERQHLVDIEADNPNTRSNDGRADPFGGFWIGTMGFQAEPGAGAIYRFYQGKLTRLFDNITISNAICFAPDGSCAYFTDTVTKLIMKHPLDSEGWPLGASEVFIDLNAGNLNPDGAVVDAEGRLWNAQWGASRVACYGPDGAFQSAVEVGATQASCPAFGGADLTQLFVTTAAEGLPADSDPLKGQVFVSKLDITGQPEHQVKV